MAFEDDPRIKGCRYDRAAADLLRHPIRDFVNVMPLAERARRHPSSTTVAGNDN